MYLADQVKVLYDPRVAFHDISHTESLQDHSQHKIFDFRILQRLASYLSAVRVKPIDTATYIALALNIWHISLASSLKNQPIPQDPNSEPTVVSLHARSVSMRGTRYHPILHQLKTTSSIHMQLELCIEEVAHHHRRNLLAA